MEVIASKAFGEKRVNWQREIAVLAPGSSFTFTGAKAHNIHLRNPDMVIAAVTKMTESGGPPPGPDDAGDPPTVSP